MDNEKIIQTEGRDRLKRTLAVRFGLAGPSWRPRSFSRPAHWTTGRPGSIWPCCSFPCCLVLAYFLKKDPELLERRMRTKEKEPQQKVIIRLSALLFLAIYLLPGFDRRFGWSSVPTFAVIAADLIILASYGLFFLVMYENRFLSRVVEVDQKQPVIDTGPYARVRHPMYAAVIPLYLFTPLALGSFWAMIPAAFFPLLLIARIFNEEKVLSRELPGYRKYARRVKFRLIPGVW